MAKIAPSIRLPWKPDNVQSDKKEDLEYFLKMLIRKLEDMYGYIADIININAVMFYDQNAKPTPNKGQMAVWNDKDATSGQSTHYLVYTDKDGNTVTFASEETVP